MRKFIYKILFLSTPLLFLLLEPLLPLSFFNYRPWEALTYKHVGIGMPFYPNQELNMTSVGDLCYYTKKEIKKNENWITDKIGYRNDLFIDKPNVLIIGDSFVAGSSLNQDSTLTNLMISKSKNKWTTYNIAPASFSNFIALWRKGVLKKPKIIVFAIAERSIPATINLSNKTVVYNNTSYTSVLQNRIKRRYALNFFKARIKNYHGMGIKGISASKMFFYNGVNQKNNLNNIPETVRNIISYKEFCDSEGIKFIFLSLPNKETVYFEKVPFKYQPDYIFKLDSTLNSNDIMTLNALKVFNNYRQSHTDLIYHLDDSHWNSKGVNLIANELSKQINELHDNILTKSIK